MPARICFYLLILFYCECFFLFILPLKCCVLCQQVWETETWMPMKTTQAVFHDELISSGDSANGSDFGFPDEEHDTFDNEDKADDNEDYDNFSGSGDGGWI